MTEIELDTEELELAVEEYRVTLRQLHAEQKQLGEKLAKATAEWTEANEELNRRRFPDGVDLWQPELFAKLSPEALTSAHAHRVLHDFLNREGLYASGTMTQDGEFVPVPVLWIAPSEVDPDKLNKINRYHRLVRDAGVLPDDLPLLISIRTEDLNRSGIPQLFLNKDGTANFSVTRYHHEQFEVKNGTSEEAWEAAARYEDQMRDEP
jgi:hypothetical protein